MWDAGLCPGAQAGALPPASPRWLSRVGWAAPSEEGGASLGACRGCPRTPVREGGPGTNSASLLGFWLVWFCSGSLKSAQAGQAARGEGRPGVGVSSEFTLFPIRTFVSLGKFT